MSIKIVDDVEIRLTPCEADRLHGEYQRAMQYYAGPYKSFETWLRGQGYGKQPAHSSTGTARYGQSLRPGSWPGKALLVPTLLTLERTMFPADDNEFEDKRITKVEAYDDGGWSILTDGWGFGGVPKESPVTPTVGMTARFYSTGLGSRVRGLFLDGQRVFYRTESEDKEHSEIELYGANASDWLKRWDEGRSVWSIEMGGLGPAYEQCIHITCAEILRVMLERQYDCSKLHDQETWKGTRDEIGRDVMALPIIRNLGLSGAQWGAAMNLAAMLYRRGPREVMRDERVKDRHIQVSRIFPGSVAA